MWEALLARKKEKGMEMVFTKGFLEKSLPLMTCFRFGAGGVLEVASSLRFCPLVTDLGGGTSSCELCSDEEEEVGTRTGESSPRTLVGGP